MRDTDFFEIEIEIEIEMEETSVASACNDGHDLTLRTRCLRHGGYHNFEVE